MATVIDLYSRRILGYAMGDRHDARLVVAALNTAAVTHGGNVGGVMSDSDRGSGYCSAAHPPKSSACAIGALGTYPTAGRLPASDKTYR
ncbi:DDE-type integrase/transposase/recombinase [Plantactinospora sp. WMMB334]|uniref:DDE-type integrase/transposase/recombinase n=1 Tax=Plantactinospora sp. WMMB334 TaxID=3404119 RepID=UPI003B9672ED